MSIGLLKNQDDPSDSIEAKVDTLTADAAAIQSDITAIQSDIAAIDAIVDDITIDTSKISDVDSGGLAATPDSVGYQVAEVDRHSHSPERWVGIVVPQTATDWADSEGGPFVAISGAGVFGADANDEAQVLGTADTPIIAGSAFFDLHRLLIVGVDHDTEYKLRVVCGTGTMADAITAGQFTEVMVKFDAANPTVSAGSPIEIQMNRQAAGTKVWIQARNATDNSEIDIYAAIHEYEG